MLIYAVDLGTTNLKVVLYDEELRRLATAAASVEYDREGVRVEFDPGRIFATVIDLVGRCAREVDTSRQDAVIALTGQAESLVLTDARGDAVRPAMSWLDDRATAEAAELEQHFGIDEAFAVTGEPAASSTWPAAKLRWLLAHEPETLDRTRAVSMIKDDLVRRLVGTPIGEVTTRGFTYLWDVRAGRYWSEMVEHCGLSLAMLPEVVPAGTDVGRVSDEVVALLPPAAGYRVNIGALDHFCAMAGTGSYVEGSVSESAGTVLSVSALQREWRFDLARRVSFHAGLSEGDTVLFNASDTGGIALEWFRTQGLGGMPYADLEAALADRVLADPPLFLPYLTGISPPDFLPHAKGAFVDLDLSHDRIDLAYAVEEGIAHLVRRNVEYLDPAAREVVSTGGGAASAHLTQLKADVCGLEVIVPDELEATCRGAAALALRAAGRIDSLDDVAALHAPPSTTYRPRASAVLDRAGRYDRFASALHRLYATNR